jgi:hypothetical protein
MFPKYGGTKLLMAALGSSLSLYFRSHVIDREVLKLCSKNPAHDCRGRQIERRLQTKSRGQGGNGRCDRCRRSHLEAVMRSLSRRESTARGRKMAAKKPVRKTKRKAPRKTSRKKRL